MFPYYLSIGMDYDLYWNGDPRLVEAYREANKLQAERKNQELWLQGVYVYRAIETVVSNIHFDNKTHKINKYLEKPLDIFAHEKADSEKKAEVEKARQTVIDKMNAWKKAWEKKGNSNG